MPAHIESGSRQRVSNRLTSRRVEPAHEHALAVLLAVLAVDRHDNIAHADQGEAHRLIESRARNVQLMIAGCFQALERIERVDETGDGVGDFRGPGLNASPVRRDDCELRAGATYRDVVSDTRLLL